MLSSSAPVISIEAMHPNGTVTTGDTVLTAGDTVLTAVAPPAGPPVPAAFLDNDAAAFGGGDADNPDPDDNGGGVAGSVM